MVARKHLVGNISKAMLFKPDTNLLRSLEPGAETLRDMLVDSPEVIWKHSYLIECFYEARGYGRHEKVR